MRAIRWVAVFVVFFWMAAEQSGSTMSTAMPNLSKGYSTTVEKAEATLTITRGWIR